MNNTELTSEQKVQSEAFHKKRKTFAWINGCLIFNQNINDDRDHLQWLQTDYHISLKEFEKTPRGYILDNRIQLFQGTDFSCITTENIKPSEWYTLINTCLSIFHPNKPIEIYNGVKPAEPGILWEPIDTIEITNIKIGE